jgi:4'-phosphopantetheinyl transferase
LNVDSGRPLEAVLAVYLGVEPGSVALRRSPAGKPELEGSSLRASLAHSGEVALVAVASGLEIGVDVERLRDGTEAWSLVAHALTPAERTRLERVPAADRSRTFLWTWSRKEALLKAVGLGLALDPRLLELDAGPRLASAPAEFGRASDWTLVDLPLPGYAAALAVKGKPTSLRLHDARIPAGPGESRAGSAALGRHSGAEAQSLPNSRSAQTAQ